MHTFGHSRLLNWNVCTTRRGGSYKQVRCVRCSTIKKEFACILDIHWSQGQTAECLQTLDCGVHEISVCLVLKLVTG